MNNKIIEPKVLDSKLYFIRYVNNSNYDCEYDYIDLSKKTLSTTFVEELSDYSCLQEDK